MALDLSTFSFFSSVFANSDALGLTEDHKRLQKQALAVYGNRRKGGVTRPDELPTHSSSSSSSSSSMLRAAEDWRTDAAVTAEADHVSRKRSPEAAGLDCEDESLAPLTALSPLSEQQPQEVAVIVPVAVAQNFHVAEVVAEVEEVAEKEEGAEEEEEESQLEV